MRVCSYPGCSEQAWSRRARYCETHAYALRVARIRAWQKAHPDQHLIIVHRYRDRRRQAEEQERERPKIREMHRQALREYVQFFARTGQ
jgi:hypothetical protein